MAEIIQRGKTWAYKVYLGTDPLTQKRIFDRKGGFKTQQEAKTAPRLVEIQKENGTYLNSFCWVDDCPIFQLYWCL
jgi:hypothetical protein